MSKKRLPQGERPTLLAGRTLVHGEMNPADIPAESVMRACDEERTRKMVALVAPFGRVVQSLVLADVDGETILVDGAGRRAAAVALGYPTVPTVHTGTWKESQRKEMESFALMVSAILSQTTKPSPSESLKAAKAYVAAHLGSAKEAGLVMGLSESGVKQILNLARLTPATLALADEGRLSETTVKNLALRCGSGAANRITAKEAEKIAMKAAESATTAEETGEIIPAPSKAVNAAMAEIIGEDRAGLKATPTTDPGKERTYAQVKEYFGEQPQSRLFKVSQIVKIFADRTYTPKENGGKAKPAKSAE